MRKTCDVILKQILMNALRLVLTVDNCVSTLLGRTTVVVALATHCSLMDTHAMVFNNIQIQNVQFYNNIIVYMQILTNVLKVLLAVIKSVLTPLAATHALVIRAIA